MKELKLQITELLKSKVVDSSKIKVVAPKGTKNTLYVYYLNVFGDEKKVEKHLVKMGFTPSEPKYDRKKKSNYFEIMVNN